MKPIVSYDDAIASIAAPEAVRVLVETRWSSVHVGMISPKWCRGMMHDMILLPTMPIETYPGFSDFTLSGFAEKNIIPSIHATIYINTVEKPFEQGLYRIQCRSWVIFSNKFENDEL